MITGVTITGRALAPARSRVVSPVAAALVTLAIFALILRRVPLTALSSALHDADYRKAGTEGRFEL